MLFDELFELAGSGFLRCLQIVEQAAIDDLQAAQEAAARELEEFVEEHGGDEGLLKDEINDKGEVNKGQRYKTTQANNEGPSPNVHGR